MACFEEIYSSEGTTVWGSVNEEDNNLEEASPGGTGCARANPALQNDTQPKSNLWSRRKGQTYELPLVVEAKTQRGVVGLEQLQMEPDVRNRYEVQHVIGSGSMAIVYRAIVHGSGGKHVALKVLKCSNDLEMMYLARHEFEVLKSLPLHPHIISPVDIHELEGGAPVVVLELFEGLTLQAATKAAPQSSLSASQVHVVSVALFSAVAHLHEHEVLHRDIKPQNILVSHGVSDLRLADFNVARALRDGASVTPVGDPNYRAPEVLAGDPCSASSDVWQSGLCIYFSLGGILPHRSSLCDMLGVHKQAWNPRPHLQRLNVPKAFEDALCRALHSDRCLRARATELTSDRVWQA